jgi:RNA polymerase-binding protein DksA
MTKDNSRANRARKTPFPKADLEHFRQLLLERRARILSQVEGMEEEALKAAGQDFSVDHMADHGSDNFEQDFTLQLVEGERKELYEIDRALTRIRQATYGICEGTGVAIHRARLEAIPYARYSIEFQRKVEAGEVEEEEEQEG